MRNAAQQLLALRSAQVRGGIRLIKLRVVGRDFSVRTLVLDVDSIEGQKDALSKAAQIQASLKDFSQDCPVRLEKLKQLIRVFSSDGERAELLSARFAKELGYLPRLRGVVRCSAGASYNHKLLLRRAAMLLARRPACRALGVDLKLRAV